MYWLTSDVKSSLLAGGAGVVGMLQTMYLRSNPGMLPTLPMIPMIGNRPASLYGVGLGGIALVIGLLGKTQGKFVTNDLYQNMLIAYGATALAGGVYDYFFPGYSVATVVAPSAVAPSAVAQAFAYNEPVAAQWVMRQLDEGVL